jgi:Methyltransferase domain
MTADTDLESRPEWLERLYSLNAVIAGCGEPLMGNLCYDPGDDFADRPPLPQYRPKRDRFRAAVRGRRAMLEVGVNGGHSAFLALTENRTLEWHGVDICEWGYVKPAVAWLEEQFPGRVHFHEGDSSRVLPELAANGLSFDVFHVDGAKELYFADIVNASRLTGPVGAVVVIDDSNYLIAKVALSSLAAFRVIRRLPQFPPMPRAVRFEDTNNEVRGLMRSGTGKYAALRGYAHVLDAARQAKALGMAVRRTER